MGMVNAITMFIYFKGHKMWETLRGSDVYTTAFLLDIQSNF